MTTKVKCFLCALGILLVGMLLMVPFMIGPHFDGGTAADYSDQIDGYSGNPVSLVGQWLVFAALSAFAILLALALGKMITHKSLRYWLYAAFFGATVTLLIVFYRDSHYFSGEVGWVDAQGVQILLDDSGGLELTTTKIEGYHTLDNGDHVDIWSKYPVIIMSKQTQINSAKVTAFQPGIWKNGKWTW